MNDIRAPRRPGPSVGPALIVVGVAVAIIVLGAIVAVLGTASAHAPTAQLGSRLPGVSIRALPASDDLVHIETAGEPPSDIVNDLSVPAGSRYLSQSTADAGVDQFDRSITVAAPYSTKVVAAFYKADLAAGHWSLQFNGVANSDRELIGQRNGSDGYQWRVAIVISNVNPALSPALAGNTPTATSKLVMSVYQVEDAS